MIIAIEKLAPTLIEKKKKKKNAKNRNSYISSTCS